MGFFVLCKTGQLYPLFVLSVCLAMLFPGALFAQGQPFYPNDPYFLYDPAAAPPYPGQWNLLNQAPSTIFYPAGVSPSTSGTPKITEAVTIFNAGLDANIVDAWRRGYTGKGIVIGIIDDGVQFAHPDLNIRRDLSVGVDATGIVAGQTGEPLGSYDSHGTCVAGMAAAIGGNGIGVTGLAPHAEIASIRAKNFITVDDWYIHAPGYYWQAGFDWTSGMDSAALAGLTGINRAPAIQIKNSSTKGIVFSYPAGYGDTYSAAARIAANGVPFTVAAGNMRRTRQQDAGTTIETSHPYSIAVAALGSDGRYALYSSFGASVFVTALSESSYWNIAAIPGDHAYANGLGVSSTDLLGVPGQNYDANASSVFLPDLADLDYTSQFDGTSAAAPSVAGMLAVAKQANPNLDARMAKHLLARTSRVVDAGDASASSTWTSGGITYTGWQTNAAGFRFNPNYGFGLLDTTALVNAALRTAYVTNETIHTTGIINVAPANQTITASDVNGKTEMVTVAVPAALKQNLEGVETYVNISGGDRSEWQITLKKDSTASRIWTPANDIPNSANPLLGDPDPTAGLDRLLVSYAFWGENPDGDWSLNVANPSGSHAATWNKWGLVLHMGDIVLETPGLTSITSDINARGLTINQGSSHLSLAPGRTLYLTGDAFLTAGHLEVNGTVRNGATVSVSKFDPLLPDVLADVKEDLAYNRGVRVNIAGGTVSGSGAIIAPAGADGMGGVFNSGGVVKPGNSIGTLTLGAGGSPTLYSQSGGGTLEMEVAGAGIGGVDNDLLVINGSAHLGGTLRTIWSGGSVPAIGTTFGTILTASSGITGQFSSLLTNITPTVVFKPKYDIPNQVYLKVEKDYANDGLLPYLSANQRAVASMLNSVSNTAAGDLDAVLGKIDALSTYAQAAAAIDQLAPRGELASAVVTQTDARMQAANISGRLQDLRAGLMGVSLRGLNIAIEQDDSLNRYGRPVLLALNGDTLPGGFRMEGNENWGIFATGNVAAGRTKDTAIQSDGAFRSAGITVGTDYRFTRNLIAGIMGGYNRTRSRLDDLGSTAAIDTVTLGVYGTYYRQGFYVDGLANYGWNNTDKDRRIVYPGVDRTAFSDQRGRTWAFSGGAGYDYQVQNWVFTPRIMLDYIGLATDDYTESGADSLNLHVDGQRTKTLQGQIGGSAAYVWKTDKATVMPRLWAMYGRKLDAADPMPTTARLAMGGSSFTTFSIPPDRNFLNLGAGITAMLPAGASLYLNAAGQAGQSNYYAYHLGIGVRVPF